jgi:hypothetical protein
MKVFELFWNLGTLRFGEPGCLGWSNVLQRESESFAEKVCPVGVSDNEGKLFEQGPDQDHLSLGVCIYYN